MFFYHTLQTAMGLLDGVEKWAVWRQSILEQRCLRCGCALSKMTKTSSLIGTRRVKMTSNSLMKAWNVARVTVLCSITW